MIRRFFKAIGRILSDTWVKMSFTVKVTFEKMSSGHSKNGKKDSSSDTKSEKPEL